MFKALTKGHHLIGLGRNIALVTTLVTTVATFFTATLVSAEELPERLQKYSEKKYKPSDVETMSAPSANPWLSYPASQADIDWDYWKIKRHLNSNSSVSTLGQPQLGVQHKLPKGGNQPFTFIPELGTFPWQNNAVDITGVFELPAPVKAEPYPEDEGSILLATEVNVEPGNAVKIDSFIGDGLYGSKGTGSGDIDYYVVRGLTAGQTLLVDLDTPVPFGPLDPFLEIYNSEGVLVADNDDGTPWKSYDSFLNITVPEDGDYYISVAGFGTFGLKDPFDSTSGRGSNLTQPFRYSEGEYSVTIGVDYFQEQEFVFFLKKGDVIGAAIDTAGVKLSLFDRTKTERQGSSQSLRSFMPKESPIPDGAASISHVVDTFGFYKLVARSRVVGPFNLKLRAALPALLKEDYGEYQTIFVDFDGALADLSESLYPNAPPGDFMADLSPLSAFLPDWGLGPEDEDALIDATMKVLKKNLVKDLKCKGGNPLFKIRLLNSRDHHDPFGEKNVSRVIVGGTTKQLANIDTIGIAQSIDVGNFDTEETAFILLDKLSSTDPLDTVSLNNVALAPGASKIDLIAVALGVITAHEAGHFLGNYHTDQFNEHPNIMDQGGNINFTVLGLGEDNIFGTADDVKVGFGLDEYVPAEGFSGMENTLSTIAWATPKGFPFFFKSESEENWIETPPADF